MLIFPAIDLHEGRVVRLKRGDYDQMTVYGDDPRRVAEGFREAGAKHLHVVDLDGAKDGAQANLRVISSIAHHSGLFVEVGGGARDMASAERYLDLGVSRIIVGTMAVERPKTMERLAARHPGRVAAGVDAKDGFVAIHGWRVVTELHAEAFLARLPDQGVTTAVYTDIARDGMLGGANLDAYRATRAIAGLNIIASGGVSSEDDIRALADMGLYGAIIGKALYTGAIELKYAIRAAEGSGT